MDCHRAHIGLYASQDVSASKKYRVQICCTYGILDDLLLKMISVGEELTLDYQYELLPGQGYPCQCGASTCRGRLY
ncbi:hypothetical protein Goshw_021794 [Gossypium schwendimanii]|uniref:Post-SET domain-containing protein n=1 Tax=Gossypium schwendimanii TaxID=34291 RepID=A0A7J9KYP3_GOSSC|nr:hypothetical protein [Gossypium schwendimanii]MBA0851538.1 hypothetical protein [Gossypium schwendimanii]